MQFQRWAIAIVLSVCAASLSGAVKPKEKLPDHYAHWLNQEVVYIITPQEKKDFLALATDDARDKFIEDFWETRNPVRGAKPNVFREEHYARLQYANSNFGRKSTTPGWMTDMGRTWILFGKPETRAPYNGYGQIYPLELWFYSNKTGNPSYPSFFYVLFFMPEDIGEYRFYRPYLDGPTKLVRGSRLTTNASVYRFLKPLSGELAQAAFTLIPGEPIDTQDFSVTMGSDMLVSRVQNYANDPFYVRRINEQRSLRASVTSTFFTQDDRPLDLSLITLKDPTDQYWLDYTVFVGTPDLGAWDKTRNTFGLTTSYRLMNERGDTIVEDSEARSYPVTPASDGRFQPFQVANRLPIVPGRYKLEVDILNRGSGRTYKGQQAIEIADGSKAVVSGPVLISSVQQVPNPKPVIPFQYFGAQFSPGRQFGAGGLRVLLQVRVPQPGDYRIEYLIAHATDHTSRRTIIDELPANEFRNGTALRSKLLSLADLPPGEYRLITTLRAAGKDEVLWANNQSFRIGDGSDVPPLYFSASAERMALPGVAAYVRGLEAISGNRLPEATAYLKQSVEQNPNNTFATQLLVQNCYGARDFREISSLFKRHGISPFESSPETLALVAMSLSYAGDPALAREVLNSGIEKFPKSTSLAAVAKQFRDGAR